MSTDTIDATPTETDLVPTPKRRGGGPQTEEGKERSRRNALKHGLRAGALVPDDLAAAVAARTAEFVAEFAPRSPYETWLVGQMGLAAARLDRCATLAIADLQAVADRAALCWEGDRRKAVEELGARLPKDPARVAQALGLTRQGADWLIERWEGLGAAARRAGGWDDDQRRLALDLLGVPPELRNGGATLPPPDDPTALAALAAAEIARLRDDQDAVLDELDEATRSMTTLGMPMEEAPSTARLRRYEAACRRSLLWAQAEWHRVRAGQPQLAPASPPPISRSAPLPVAAPVVVRPDPARVVEAPRTIAVEAPIAPFPELSPTCPPPDTEIARPRNRRARRALERQALQAERRAAR